MDVVFIIVGYILQTTPRTPETYRPLRPFGVPLFPDEGLSLSREPRFLIAGFDPPKANFPYRTLFFFVFHETRIFTPACTVR